MAYLLVNDFEQPGIRILYHSHKNNLMVNFFYILNFGVQNLQETFNNLSESDFYDPKAR